MRRSVQRSYNGERLNGVVVRLACILAKPGVDESYDGIKGNDYLRRNSVSDRSVMLVGSVLRQ